MNVHIIRTDGSEERLQAPFRDVADLIGAETLDTVNLRDGRVMMVDDAGYEFEVVEREGSYRGMPAHIQEHRVTRARKPVNAKATALYHAICVPGATHQIVGDVAVVVDAEVDA